MFLFFPLLLIIISVLGISAIVWRKRTYLNKLYDIGIAGGGVAGPISNGSNLSWTDFGLELLPELKNLLSKLKINAYKTTWLIEAEKFLRRSRLIFLKIDRFSDLLIKKIRRVHVNGQLHSYSIETKESQNRTEESKQVQDQVMSPAFLKNEEERLIMEIAKSPKEGKLYEALGDLYLEMKNWTDAKESYEASIELNPRDESLKQKLSSALEKVNSHS